MARLDGTGPRGMGPRTGRGLGNCPTGNSKEELEKEKKELQKRIEEIDKKLKSTKE